MTNTDQWKTDGICSKCRRKAYCGKQCKAAKEGTLRQLRRYVGKLMPTAVFDKCNVKRKSGPY